MSKSAKNLIVVLGILTTVFGAYYFLTLESPVLGIATESDVQLQQLLVTMGEYNARQRTLNSIQFDTSIFQSVEFNSLRGYSPELEEFPTGRADPFLPTRLDTPRTPVVQPLEE
jgi:hypothetical protein